MNQPTLQTDWRSVWRRYETMRRMENQRKKSFWARLNAWWLGIDPYYRCVAPLVGLNMLVFLLWRVHKVSVRMYNTFLAQPMSSNVSSLFFSTFSHQETWHLLGNMIGLVSFGRAVYDMLGSEQFTAFYLSAGVFSSYCSWMLKFVFGTTSVASLGASGAVYAVMALALRYNPNISISLIFLPFLPISGQLALLGLLLFDVFGLISRRTPFDHPAHLGGMAWGYFYLPIRVFICFLFYYRNFCGIDIDNS